jgi:hypothetical protein
MSMRDAAKQAENTQIAIIVGFWPALLIAGLTLWFGNVFSVDEAQLRVTCGLVFGILWVVLAIAAYASGV